MPCLCGDLYCHSCGPAQGNNHCPFCGAWTADGGCADPEKCEAEARKWADEEVAELQLIEHEVSRLSDDEYVAIFGHRRIK